MTKGNNRKNLAVQIFKVHIFVDDCVILTSQNLHLSGKVPSTLFTRTHRIQLPAPDACHVLRLNKREEKRHNIIISSTYHLANVLVCELSRQVCVKSLLNDDKELKLSYFC